jgi:PAS domain S-box-containing protein
VKESDLQIFETVGALVVVLEVGGRIVYWNHCCSDLTGYTLEEVRGRTLWDFALIAEEIAPVKAIFETLDQPESPGFYANYWLTKTGKRRWIVWSHTLIKGPDGRVQFIIKTGTDRTENKRATDALRNSGAELGLLAAESARLYEDARRHTDELREANQQMVSTTIQAQEQTEEAEAALTRSEERERQLRAVAELRETFIGMVGHDLRNPLGTIVFSTQLLLAGGHLDAEERKGVSRIIASTERMSRIILQLLDLTRARLGGGIPLDARPVNLADVCRGVVEEFEATIHLQIEGDVSGTWDPDRLTEALSSITANAIDHARPRTAVVVRARPEGAGVVVEVINHGDPIPADVLPFIFEPFHRGRRTASTTGRLGLGLYIANQIVLASGGSLQARSAGGTTTFAMHLPHGPPAPIPSHHRN